MLGGGQLDLNARGGSKFSLRIIAPLKELRFVLETYAGEVTGLPIQQKTLETGQNSTKNVSCLSHEPNTQVPSKVQIRKRIGKFGSFFNSWNISRASERYSNLVGCSYLVELYYSNKKYWNPRGSHFQKIIFWKSTKREKIYFRQKLFIYSFLLNCSAYMRSIENPLGLSETNSIEAKTKLIIIMNIHIHKNPLCVPQYCL